MSSPANFLKSALAVRKPKLAGASGLLLALILIVSLASPVLAVPGFPQKFWGTVKVMNAVGQPFAPEGTIVSVEIDGVEYVTKAVNATGNYGTFPAPYDVLTVPADDNQTIPKEGAASGDTLDFYVLGSKILAASVAYVPGATTELNLEIDDPDPPVVTIDPVTPDPTANTTPTLTGTATDALCDIGNVQYRIDGGGWTDIPNGYDSLAENWTVTLPALADGVHTVDVRARDIAENWTQDGNYASDTFAIDTTNPVVAFDSYTNPTADDTPTFTGTIADASDIVDVQYQVDGGGFIPLDPADFDNVSFTFTTAALAGGAHTVDVKAIDAVGNEGQTSGGITISVDGDDPVVTVTPVVPDPTTDTTPTISGTLADASGIDSVEWQLDGGGWMALDTADYNDTSFSFVPATPLSLAQHTVCVRATDGVGNTSDGAACDTFTVEGGPDLTAPGVQSTIPANFATNRAVDTVVSATFDEDVTAVNLAGVTIAGATGVSAALNAVTDTLNILHDPLDTGTPYTVTIPAGAVQDLSGNPNAEYSWSFTTVFPDTVYTLVLGEEWNIVSTPIALDPSLDTWGEVAAILNPEIVYYYDTMVGAFMIPGDSYPFAPLDAFYVYMPEGGGTIPVIPATFATPPPSKTVSTGWNLLGGAAYLEPGNPTIVTNKPLDEVLISLYYAPGETNRWGYTQVVSQGYNQAPFSYIRDIGPVPDFAVGTGVWVSIDNEDIYTGPSMTPWP